jgi:acetyltransferase
VTGREWPGEVPVERVGADGAGVHEGDLAAVLMDSVEGGASVGFLPPLDPADAIAYWRSVAAALRDGVKVLLIARGAGGHVVGTGQLALEPRANASHRAEVQKLMVLRSARRRGVGRALMLALEGEARRRGRTTLVLDTRQGDPSEALYQSLGWVLAGVIPRFARSANGALDASAFYYKLLGPAEP